MIISLDNFEVEWKLKHSCISICLENLRFSHFLLGSYSCLFHAWFNSKYLTNFLIMILSFHTIYVVFVKIAIVIFICIFHQLMDNLAYYILIEKYNQDKFRNKFSWLWTVMQFNILGAKVHKLLETVYYINTETFQTPGNKEFYLTLWDAGFLMTSPH